MFSEPTIAVDQIMSDGRSVSTSDIDWIENDLKKLSIWKRNPALCTHVVKNILPSWKRDLATQQLNNPWTKVRKRLVKEFNESEPCISFIENILERNEDSNNKFIIVDLCSGFGILSMLLSELLPKDRVDKIWLIDKRFPMTIDTEAKSHQISMQHLKRQWPIQLKMRKVDLKASREIKQLHKYVFRGRVIFVGIHLCKSLSVHAIKLYQSYSDAVALVLKPCCLPGSRNLYAPVEGKTKPIVYQFENGYSFRPIDLYQDVDASVTDDANSENNDYEGTMETNEDGCSDSRNPHHDKNFNNERFSRWVNCLCRGCDSARCRARVESIRVQKHHFQNLFIFSEIVQQNAATGETVNQTPKLNQFASTII
jgi:hypothetical protein